jgi:PAS domain S-box-containing protein
MHHSSISRQRLQHLSKEELLEIILQTDTHVSREELYEEWAVYQKIFDESTDALFLTHPDNYKIQLCNKRALEMFGFHSKEELLGKVGAGFRRYVGEVTDEDELQENNHQIEYRSRKGHTFWGLRKVTRIQIRDKTYRLVRITDITSQKEQEKKSLYYDKLYQSVINTQQEMVCHFKPDTTVTFANEAYARNLGMSSEELIGKKFLELIPEKDHHWIMQRLCETAEKGQPNTNKHIVEAGDGAYYWHQWTDIPIFDENGKLVEFQAVGQDISSRVRMEQRIKEGEEKFRTLVMTVPVGIFLTDEQGNCNWINRQLEQMFQISFQQALADGLYQRILDEDKDQIMGIFKGGIGSDTVPYSREGRYQLDDKIRWARFTLTPLRNESQEIKGFVGIVEDFTERKDYEETLLDTQSELKSAMKAKDDFLSVMSHEIRTPLNSIIGLTQLMADSSSDNDHQEVLKTLQYSSSQLLTLVNDILDFSKLRAGKLKLEHIPFDLKELLYQAVSLFQNQADLKNIELVCQIEEDLPVFIHGDPTRLGQVLNNLLSNAIKFTEEGQVKLDVKKTKEGSLLIEVEDSGIGMTKEEEMKVFKAFIQANSSTNRKYGGTGLGLTITEKLVKLQQGTVNFRSKSGEGSIFTVVLPLYPAKEPAKYNNNQLTDLSKLKQLKMLYVEDVVPNQFLMKNLCQRWGTSLEVVSSGEEAIAKLKADTYFDIILMDIMMPGMDGYQTTQRIRQMAGEYYQKVPIVALTASVSNRETQMYKKYGLNDFVEKPLNSQVLIQKILESTHMSIKRSAPAVPPTDDKESKNMFTLLREYHEQHPDEFLEMLRCSAEGIRKYQSVLLDTLRKREIDQYRQQVHKVVSYVMLLENKAYVKRLRDSVQMLEEGKDEIKIGRGVKVVLSEILEDVESMVQKSKNLLK